MVEPGRNRGNADAVTGVQAGGRLYGRRRGRRLRSGREALLRTLLPQVAVPLPPAGEQLTSSRLFPGPVADLWLEVGFGAGEHLAWQAAQHPQIGFIGCEPFVNGVAALLRQIADNGLHNIRVYTGDAGDVLSCLAAASLGRCFVLFPDPWPKRRHWRRRFIQSGTLEELARTLRDHGELRLASDDPGLVDWMLHHTRRHPAFVWTATRARDWRERPADWPSTRYEEKRLRGVPVFLRFRRRRRDGGPGRTRTEAGAGGSSPSEKA